MKAAIVVAIAAVLAVAGCKEGVGERCQVDDDCSGGLVCNQAQMVCSQPGTSGGIDATVPAPMDAAIPFDAPADAPADAS